MRGLLFVIVSGTAFATTITKVTVSDPISVFAVVDLSPDGQAIGIEPGYSLPSGSFDIPVPEVAAPPGSFLFVGLGMTTTDQSGLPWEWSGSAYYLTSDGTYYPQADVGSSGPPLAPFVYTPYAGGGDIVISWQPSPVFNIDYPGAPVGTATMSGTVQLVADLVVDPTPEPRLSFLVAGCVCLLIRFSWRRARA